MTKPYLVIAHRPPGSSCIDDISVPAVGWFQKRVGHGIDGTFPRQALVIIVAGCGSFSTDRHQAEVVTPGCMWFLRPGIHYRYSPVSGSGWEEYFIDLAGPGLSRWSRYGLLPQEVGMHRFQDIARTVERLRALMSTLHEGVAGAADRAVVQVESLLVDLRYEREASSSAQASNASLHAALSSIQRSYRSTIHWERLAKDHAMSYMTLRRGLKKLTGRSPARYVNMLRCEVARRLLTETALSVKEVGQSVGIPHPVSFCRCFRREFGKGPEAFRRSSRVGVRVR